MLTHDFPPYNYKQDGKLIGINTDIITKVLQEENVPFEIEVINWARAQIIVQNTPNTGLLSAGRSPVREDKYAWIGPLVSSTSYLFKLSSRKDIVVKSLDDLSLYRIAITRRSVRVHTFEKMGLTAPRNLLLVSNASDTYQGLFKNRADFILGSDLTTPYNVRNLGYDLSDIEPVIKIGDQNIRNYLAVNKAYSPDIIARSNARISKMWESGEIDRIIDSYRLQPKMVDQ
ncbi:MAG: substrate-binding periplasmic protein [Aestuariibacter sp.]